MRLAIRARGLELDGAKAKGGTAIGELVGGIIGVEDGQVHVGVHEVAGDHGYR